MNIREQKKKLRVQVREKLEQYSHEWILEQSKIIVEHILNSTAYQNANAIFCYVSFGKEVNTIPILEHALENGKRVGVPLCTGKGIMEVREIHSLKDLKSGAYGILEPKEQSTRMEKTDIAYGIIPCVSADRQGRRLGHGAGFYDRYLEGARFTKVILCFEEIMALEVPVDEHDIEMDQVVSQEGIRTCSG